MGLFKSASQGTNWKTMTNAQVNWMAFDPAHPGGLYLAIENEGIGKSANGGETVQMVNQGFVDRTISSVAQSGNKLLALETQLGESSGIFVSADRGENWSQLGNVRGLGGVHLTTIAGMPSEDRILLAASPHQIYKSIDAGITWKPIPVRLVTIVPPPPEPKKNCCGPREKASKARGCPAQATRKNSHPLAFRNQRPLHHQTWREGCVVCRDDLGLLISGDAGERWTQSDIPMSMAVTALYAAPNNDGRLVARASAGLFESKDFGDHWTPLSFPLPSGEVNAIALPANPDLPIFVATRVGLYSSPDGGAKWFANLGGIPASTVTSVLFAAKKRPMPWNMAGYMRQRMLELPGPWRRARFQSRVSGNSGCQTSRATGFTASLAIWASSSEIRSISAKIKSR